jgi:hypothetical protein
LIQEAIDFIDSTELVCLWFYPIKTNSCHKTLRYHLK